MTDDSEPAGEDTTKALAKAATLAEGAEGQAVTLNSLISKLPPGSRPFTCEGLPQNCTVIVIGENPSTAMGNWRTWWDKKHGFDLTEFEKAYTEERPRASPTRLYLRRLRSHRLLRCLETNVFPREKPDGHAPDDKPQLDLLRWFLSLPSITDAVVHGDEAQAWMEPLIPKDWIRYWPMPHFSSREGKVSYDIIDALAEKIKAAQRGSRSA